jgi:hypothetical protein
MAKIFLSLFLFAVVAAAQKFGFGAGVKGGYPFTGLFVANNVAGNPVTTLSSSNNYLVGPAMELRIPFGFAIEVDGLYRGTRYDLNSANGTTAAINSASWEIPYLAKFRFPIPVLKPFVEGGGSYRTFTNLPTNITPSHNAFVLGGGLELKISHLRLSGEARWQRWGQPATNLLVQLGQNQGEVLFGIMF